MLLALLLVAVAAAPALADDYGEGNAWFASHHEFAAGFTAADLQVGRVVLHDHAFEVSAALCRGKGWYELAYALGVADGTGAATSQHAAVRVRREVLGADENGYLVRRYAAWVEAGAGVEALTGRGGDGELRPVASLGVGLDADRSVDETTDDRRYVGLRLGVRLLASRSPDDAGAALCLGACTATSPSSRLDLGLMLTASVVISP